MNNKTSVVAVMTVMLAMSCYGKGVAGIGKRIKGKRVIYSLTKHPISHYANGKMKLGKANAYGTED